MNFSDNKAKEHQFPEVDEDLRRIGEREASKPLCPFGTKCYRKNPNHWQDFRHKADPTPKKTPNDRTQQKDRNERKRGQITDYFNKRPNDVKKGSADRTKDESDYEIEDNSDEEPMTTSKERPNTSVSSERTPKRVKFSPFKTKTETKTNSNQKKRLRRIQDNGSGSDSDFGNDLNAIINNDFEVKPKKVDLNKKSKTSSKVNKLEIIEEINANNETKGMKNNESIVETKGEKERNNKLKESDDSKPPIADPFKPKLTPKELNEVLKDIFLVEMPKDFFHLWQFCKTLNPRKPEEALVEGLGLRLVGPYDVLTGRIKKSCIEDREQVLCHWRYYYDSPEMQTILASNKSGFHLGYFRDTPEEENPVVVSNNGDTSCIIEGKADNIFGAIYGEIQKLKSKDSSDKSLAIIETKVKSFCTQNKIDFKDNSKVKSRKSIIIAKTFNGFGCVVPYDKKTELGYRPLPETDSNLKKLLTNIIKLKAEERTESKGLTELQEIIQLVSYANDEYDFGMGLELGLDLFCFGDPFFHKSVSYLLSMAYDLLKRQAFSRIIKAHINNRRKGFRLDSL